MKNALFIICLLCTGFLFSCDDQKNKSTDMPVEESTIQMPPPVDPATPPTQPQVSGTENSITPTVAAPNVTPTVDTKVATAPGMNPPHGQPGHDCDIAVGAPLNSPKKPGVNTPAPPSEPQVISSPQPINVTPSPTPPPSNVPTPPGMNPPHGQPGHDCNIAVGAPLKK